MQEKISGGVGEWVGGWVGGRPNLVYSPGPGLWSLVLGSFGPDLGPDLDLIWDLDLDLSLTIEKYCNMDYRALYIDKRQTNVGIVLSDLLPLAPV